MNIDKYLVDWILGREPWKSIHCTKENNQLEYLFSTFYLQASSRRQWTSRFGEELVRHLLIEQGHDVSKPKIIEGMLLDLETKDAFYEVKTRAYSAGEKIFATPYKYCKIYALTGKLVHIVLVGNQEVEGRHKFHLDHPSDDQQRFLIFINNEYHIQYVFCSSLLLPHHLS